MARSKSGTSLANILLIVAIIGALNWGLVGFFNWNLVDAIFGGQAASITSPASRVVYAIVGLCGLAALFFLPKMRFLKRDETHTGHTVGTTRTGTTRREVHP